MCMHAIVLCSTCSSATLHNAGWDVSLPQLHGLKRDRARKDVQELLAYHATSSSADCIVSRFSLIEVSDSSESELSSYFVPRNTPTRNC